MKLKASMSPSPLVDFNQRRWSELSVLAQSAHKACGLRCSVQIPRSV
jgi:hypothetical protein